MTNASDFIADSTKPWAAAIVQSNNLIADAMGYTALPTAYKNAIWTQVDATDAAGQAPAVSAPAAQFSDPVGWSYQGTWNASTNTPTLTSGVGTENHLYQVSVTGSTNLDGETSWPQGSKCMFKDGAWFNATNAVNVTCTQAEAQTIYGTHVAHALWLEYQQTFPWRITSYSLEECQGLFDPALLYDFEGSYGSWDTAASPYLELGGIASHDVAGTYQWVTGTLFSGYTHRSIPLTVGELLDRCSSDATYSLLHHNSTGPSGCVLSPVQQFSAGNVQTSKYVSRRGCHTTSPLLVIMARSINLSARVRYQITDGTVHHAAEFLSIRLPPRPFLSASDPFYINTYSNSAKGGVLSHGDWMYDIYWRDKAGLRKLAPRGYYNDRVIGQAAATIELESTRMSLYSHFGVGLPAMFTRYQANGWQWMYDTWIAPYLPLPSNQGVLNRIRADLKARNGGVEIP